MNEVGQVLVANAAVLITLLFLAVFMAATLFLAGRQDDF